MLSFLYFYSMAQFIKLYNKNPNQKEIDKIVKILQNGGLIIYPTDTMYGLGCDFPNTKALEKDHYQCPILLFCQAVLIYLNHLKNVKQ